MRGRSVFLLLLSCVAWSGADLLAQWPQFRGPNGAGVGDGAGYPVEFSPAKNVAWKAAVPFGRSSPVIAGRTLYATGRDGDRLLTLAIAADSGRELWRRGVRRERTMEMYRANDPASPTPAADGDGVVSFFAEYGLVAYAADGAVRWTHAMGPFVNFYGMSASPIIADGLVVQLIDQLKGSYLIALDRASGQVRWKVDRPEATIGYATPIVFRPPSGRPELVAIGTTRLDSYDLETGAIRWWMPLGSSGSMGVALAQGDTLWMSTLGHDEPGLPAWRSALATFDADANGRLTPAELMKHKELGEHFGWIDTDDDRVITEQEWNVARSLGMGSWGTVAIRPADARGQLPAAAVTWRMQKNVPYVPAPLLYRDVLYMVKTGGIVTTLDAATGRLLKEGRATGALGEYYASPVAADGKVYIANRDGQVSVLEAGAEWKLLRVNDLGEEIEATPALAGGRVYVRTKDNIYCFTAGVAGSAGADGEPKSF
ncbi:MAG TPA: PQQ-binding-like beta-propeller repeat protein [Vicinamibacterales bacterium]|nr:PQQ-binding-like beta-propeller repeat protein [Vicinamibacterales bacterium]